MSYVTNYGRRRVGRIRASSRQGCKSFAKSGVGRWNRWVYMSYRHLSIPFFFLLSLSNPFLFPYILLSFIWTIIIPNPFPSVFCPEFVPHISDNTISVKNNIHDWSSSPGQPSEKLCSVSPSRFKGYGEWTANCRVKEDVECLWARYVSGVFEEV